MEVVISYSKEFKRKYKLLKKKYPSLEDDIKELILHLKEKPDMGVSLGRGLRKVRVAIKSKGKGSSGGSRIITFHFSTDRQIYDLRLLTIFDKAEYNNISDSYMNQLISFEREIQYYN